MSDETNNNSTDGVPVGVNDSASGESTETKTYSSDFVEKLKKEKENWKLQASNSNSELEKFKADQKTREEKAARESDDFKKLFEMKSKELEDLQGRLNESKTRELDSKKASVLKSELEKLGLDSKYADKATRLADLKQIKIDNETGVIYGADMVAKTLSEEWPALFGTATETVKQNAPAHPKPTGALTLEEWQKLPYDERRKREGELFGKR